jgi:diguanylate cyclase (GGDEF)-like protein
VKANIGWINVQGYAVHRLVPADGAETLEARRLHGLELAMDHLPVAIGIFTLEGKPIYLNKPFVELYALDWWQEDDASFARMIERGTFRHWKTDPQQHFERMMKALLQGQPLAAQIDCGERVISVHDRLLDDRFILSTQADVTARVLAERQVSYLAHHDPLTHLLNRAGFSQRLGQTLSAKAAGGGRFAVASLDLDHFKEVNDLYGHAAGDAILAETAARMRLCLDTDDYIGRLGGDEFLLISNSDDQPSAVNRIATRLQHLIQEPIEFEGQRMRVGVSIGMAIYPLHGEGRAELLKSADLALYLSKAEGRGRISLYDGAGQANQVLNAHEADLRQVEQLLLVTESGTAEGPSDNAPLDGHGLRAG